MKEIKATIDFIIEISTLIYGKQVFFYNFDNDEWYSRDHCRNVTYYEIIEWLKSHIYPMLIDE